MPTLSTSAVPDVSPAISNPCEDAQGLATKAERCRRLAAGISDRQTAEVLIGLAQGYEEAAERLAAGD